MTEPNAYQLPHEVVQLGSYRVLAELARGGMAAVFLALREPRQFPVPAELAAVAQNPARIESDPAGVARLVAANGDVVAIKQIHPHLAFDPEFVAMLLDEASIASRIHHPNVVELRECALGDVGGTNFIAMEYVAGESLSLVLKGLISRGGRMSPALVASVGADVAGALHAAHELRGPHGEPLSLVHRDISPQNIIVTYDGRVKLTDFGVAKAVGRLQRTQPGEIKGKLAYMAPEQAYGRDVDRRSDVYSLGVVLFELAMGRRLFGGRSDAETIRNIMQHTIPPPRSIDPSFPGGLEEIILGMLKADPAQRFQSAVALERALRGFVTSNGGGDLEAQRGDLVRALEPNRYHAKTELLVRELARNAPAGSPSVRPAPRNVQQPHAPIEDTELSATTPSLAPPSAEGKTRAFDTSALLGNGAPAPGERTMQAQARPMPQRPATYAAPAARGLHAPAPVNRTEEMEQTWRAQRQPDSSKQDFERTVQFDPSLALGSQGAPRLSPVPPQNSPLPMEQTFQSSTASLRPPAPEGDSLEQTTPTVRGQPIIERTVMAAVSPDVYARMVDAANARSAQPGNGSFQGNPSLQGHPSFPGQPRPVNPALAVTGPAPQPPRSRTGLIVGAMVGAVLFILAAIVLVARVTAN